MLIHKETAGRYKMMLASLQTSLSSDSLAEDLFEKFLVAGLRRLQLTFRLMGLVSFLFLLGKGSPPFKNQQKFFVGG